MNKAVDGDLAVDRDLRHWVMNHLVVAAKELPAAATVRLAQAVGELFGGRDIGGECGRTLARCLLAPASKLNEAQLQALTNGFARAGILDGSVSPAVALCRLYMRLAGSLSRDEQLQAMTELVKAFGQGPALEVRCNALMAALGQRASSMSPIHVRSLVEGIARGIGGPQGLSHAQTTWLLKRMLAMPGMEGDQLEAAVQGVTRALGGADTTQGRCEQLADALAASMTASGLASGRIDAVMRAVLKPRGEAAPGPERAGWMLDRLLDQPHSLPFETSSRMFRHLVCKLLVDKDDSMKRCIARVQGSVRGAPAWYALGVTAGEHPSLRQALLQGLAKAPLADSRTAGSETPPTHTDMAVVNVVQGLTSPVLRRMPADMPAAERQARLDALMDDVMQHLDDAPESHWRPTMQGLCAALNGRHMASTDLQWAMSRLLKAAAKASNRQLGRLAQGLAWSVGGHAVSSEHRRLIEAELEAARGQLSPVQFRLLRFGLAQAFKPLEAGR